MRSVVAAAVAAPAYHIKPALTCPYYSYWSGVPTNGVELYVRPGQSMVAIPTNDGLTCVVAIRRASGGPAAATIETATAHRNVMRAGTAVLARRERPPRRHRPSDLGELRSSSSTSLGVGPRLGRVRRDG